MIHWFCNFSSWSTESCLRDTSISDLRTIELFRWQINEDWLNSCPVRRYPQSKNNIRLSTNILKALWLKMFTQRSICLIIILEVLVIIYNRQKSLHLRYIWIKNSFKIDFYHHCEINWSFFFKLYSRYGSNTKYFLVLYVRHEYNII